MRTVHRALIVLSLCFKFLYIHHEETTDEEDQTSLKKNKG